MRLPGVQEWKREKKYFQYIRFDVRLCMCRKAGTLWKFIFFHKMYSFVYTAKEAIYSPISDPPVWWNGIDLFGASSERFAVIVALILPEVCFTGEPNHRWQDFHRDKIVSRNHHSHWIKLSSCGSRWIALEIGNFFLWSFDDGFVHLCFWLCFPWKIEEDKLYFDSTVKVFFFMSMNIEHFDTIFI